MSEVNYNGDGPLFALFESRARANDPQTSKDAAKQVNVKSIRALILSVFKNHPEGLASFELSLKMALPRDYVSPHLKPLSKMGLLRKTGLTRINPQTSNRTKCEVWRLTEKGQSQILQINVSIEDLQIKRLKQIDFQMEALQKERKLLVEVFNESRSTNQTI